MHCRKMFCVFGNTDKKKWKFWWFWLNFGRKLEEICQLSWANVVRKKIDQNLGKLLSRFWKSFMEFLGKFREFGKNFREILRKVFINLGSECILGKISRNSKKVFGNNYEKILKILMKFQALLWVNFEENTEETWRLFSGNVEKKFDPILRKL